MPGKVGQALRFVGRVPDAVPVGSRTFAWTRDVPILVRGMAKARDVIFMAGPEDVLDEPEALKTFDAEETQEAIQKQADALAGRRGAILRAVHPDDGETLAETRIEAPPVWDGMAVARNKLFLADTDGNLRCYAPKETKETGNRSQIGSETTR
ncbi:MAG: hypothetical protein R6U98_11820 [Pirellulaceae bacterium]